MPKEVCAEDFKKHVGSTFTVHIPSPEGSGLPPQQLELKLVSADEWQQGKVVNGSVIFEGVHHEEFPHIEHVVTHPEMGEMKLLLGPIVTPGDDQQFEFPYSRFAK
ncbi:MAG: hypothetical protein GTN78_00630 [Gemmatimonadales bacterium]|nr:hypothetical protein [Gemmatimonadales bacterium]NIN10044.1 hypothetical protein [Gemmatimonadales bacterium]NIQ98697.1 hypothetical protein [Gemmatimonadales bacterium]NIS63573.1 hypothetical protein [Gemmatimonadales bacterium]